MGKTIEECSDETSKEKNGVKLAVIPDALNEEECIEEFEEYMPDPPDGGWGWVIMVASFFNNFILDGIAYSFGVFLNEYVQYFNESVGFTSLANSLLCGTYLLIGPIVGALVNKYGCRVVGMAGSLIGAIAFVLSTFSPNIEVLIFTYGILGGIGFGMMYLPAVVGVGYYFERRRAVATGIAVCGTGIGTFCMAPLAKLLLVSYDWRNAHYILAGIILQGCVSSALMRPLVAKRKVKKDDQNTPERERLLSPTQTDTSTNKYQSVHRSIQRLTASAYLQRAHPHSHEDAARPLYKKDIFFSGSVYHIPEFRSQANMDGRMNVGSVTSIRTEEETRLRCLRHLPGPMADILAEMLDIKLLRSKGMMVLCLANIIGMTGFYVPIVFTADRAEKLGVSPTDAAFLLSIMGICNTVGRVLSGILSTIPSVSPLVVNNICLTLAGISVVLTPFCVTYTTMAISIAGYGLFCSTYISLASVIMCELVGLEKLTNGFGLLCLVRGITAIAGPPIEGQLYDLTGSYDATFYFGGVCLLISAGLHFLLHLNTFKANPK